MKEIIYNSKYSDVKIFKEKEKIKERGSVALRLLNLSEWVAVLKGTTSARCFGIKYAN